MGREIVCMQTVLGSSSYPQTAFVGASMATPATVTYSSMKSILDCYRRRAPRGSVYQPGPLIWDGLQRNVDCMDLSACILYLRKEDALLNEPGEGVKCLAEEAFYIVSLLVCFSQTSRSRTETWKQKERNALRYQ